MAPLAVLARPQLQEMLVVGLGGGRVLEAVAPSVRHVDIIELESKVIDANRRLAAIRSRDPLSDARFNLIVNDARSALQLTSKKYDAVISQPSHPWTAGASHLYTREFMQQVRDHLNPGGLFVQWMSVDFLDESLLRSLVATISSAYPHVRLYRPAPPTLLFLASDAPIEPEREAAATRAAIDAGSDYYGRIGLNVMEDLIASLALNDEGSRAFAAGAAGISDDVNRFAVASLFDSGRNLSAEQLGELLSPYDPLLQPNSFGQDELQQPIAFDYVARRIESFIPLDRSSLVRLKRLADRREQLGRSDNAAKVDPDSAMLRATDLAVRNDWGGVAALDVDLAQIPWTSPSIRQAVLLRVQWRLRSPDTESRSHLTTESVALIDRLNIIQPDPRLYLLRALSAGDDKYVLQESLFRYTLAILQGHVTVDDEARLKFAGLQRLFWQLRFNDPVEQHHHAEVQSTVDAVAATLR